MCIVCVELIKQSMTVVEAERNLDELTWSSTKPVTSDEFKHQFQLKDALDTMDVEEVDRLLSQGLEDEARNNRLLMGDEG